MSTYKLHQDHTDEQGLRTELEEQGLTITTLRAASRRGVKTPFIALDDDTGAAMEWTHHWAGMLGRGKPFSKGTTVSVW